MIYQDCDSPSTIGLHIHIMIYWDRDSPFLVSSWSGRVGWEHRRRMETEAMEKVVASVKGSEFIPFLAALAILRFL